MAFLDETGAENLTADIKELADQRYLSKSTGDLIQNNFAIVETGTTASRSYSVGDFVVVNGILKEVINNISNGATFTDNNTKSTNSAEAFGTKSGYYYPDFYFGTTKVTIDAYTFFSYINFSNKMLMLFGRVHITNKNGASNNNMLSFNLPSGIKHSGTSNPGSLGVVVSTSITSFTIRLDNTNTNRVFIANGSSGGYAAGAINAGDYLSILAFIPLQA